jgi:transcriptional regulator with XRE-family HTH domain
MANIVTVNDFVPDDFNPVSIARGIAGRMKERRLELNLSQQGLSVKAGVSLGSLKRFESASEISLKNLLMIAVSLDATEEFRFLFPLQQYTSIDQLLTMKRTKIRKRGRNV